MEEQIESAWLSWPAGVPLLLAASSFVLPARFRPWCGAIAAASLLTLAFVIAAAVLEQGSLVHELAGWGAPAGIVLYADGFSALMLVTNAVVGAGVSLHAFALLRQPASNGQAVAWFWPLWLFLWCGLNAVALSRDVFNLYVALEVLSLSAVALVTVEGKATALHAAMRYLLASLAGSFTYLFGVALLYSACGVLDLAALEHEIGVDRATRLAAAMMTAGLLMKTALFPLHTWLAPAHSSAPAPVSALLSGLVVKASFFMIVRLWFGPFRAILPSAGWEILGILGVVAIVWGAVLALRQRRLKLLVAYSTVAQIGYLFLLFPLVWGAGGGAAFAGGIYQVLTHACAKASLFLAAGNIAQAFGHDELRLLRGAAGRLPLSFFAIGLSGMSLMGVPPSGGFVAKWLLLSGSIAAQRWGYVAVIAGGSLLTGAYLLRVVAPSLATTEKRVRTRPVPFGMEASAFALGIAALLLGFVSDLPLAILAAGAPVGLNVPGSDTGGPP